jgi:hypothetical protein
MAAKRGQQNQATHAGGMASSPGKRDRSAERFAAHERRRIGGPIAVERSKGPIGKAIRAIGHRIRPMAKGEHAHTRKRVRGGGSHQARVAVEPRNHEHARGPMSRHVEACHLTPARCHTR